MFEVPIVVGSAGLTGRQQQPRPVEEPDEPIGVDSQGRPVWESPRAVGKSMPSNCRRVLSSPLREQAGCTGCPGMQRDGGCLLDVIRAADAAGTDWCFEIDTHDGFWDYAGPSIPGYGQVKQIELVGVYEGRWDPGSEPPEPFLIEPPVPSEYDCPWCGQHVIQDPANFHFWCPACGRNATDAKEG